GPVSVKVPFSPADLIIWKELAGPYREDPGKVGRVMGMMIKTQNPDWDCIQVILDTLMDSREKQMVLRTARMRAEEDVRTRTVDGAIDQNFPTGDPLWDPNREDHMERLQRYQQWILYGVQNAVPKTRNWSKLYEIRQEKNESPTKFLE
ncbi:hypothetical protein N332_12737, partial [Mesitornis unicolor]